MIRRLWQGIVSLRHGRQGGHWDFAERRELVRLRCHLEVRYSVGERTYFGQILDMSLGGMMLRCLQPPVLTSVTKVTYDSSVPGVTESTVACRVQWQKASSRDRQHFVGLSYFDSEDVLRASWIKAELRQLGFRPHQVFRKRRHVRTHCFLPVSLTDDQGVTCGGHLYNLAAGGALLETEAVLAEGERVALRIGPHQGLAVLALEGRIASRNHVDRLQFLGIEFGPITKVTHRLLGAYLEIFLREGALG